MTDKKQVQKARILRYFLDSTKSLIISQGISGLTTKKIGDHAGYSYATLYNYFENLNELLCMAIEEINIQVVQSIKQDWTEANKKKGQTELSGRITGLMDLVLQTFAGNPNLYYPFISTELDFSYFTKRDGHPYVHPAYTLLYEEIISQANNHRGDQDFARNLADTLMYVFHAKLHFYIRYQVPNSQEQLHQELNNQLTFILQGLTK